MNDELILVEKDGEQLEIHPTTLKSHEAAGWKLVEGSKKTKNGEKAARAEAEKSKADKAKANPTND